MSHGHRGHPFLCGEVGHAFVSDSYSISPATGAVAGFWDRPDALPENAVGRHAIGR